MNLCFDRVTKLYGPVIGVNDITCEIGPGITGLFGSNGAGKTTFLKLASGQLKPTLGQVRLGASDSWSAASKRLLGLCPDIDRFYERMSVAEFVLTIARLHGYPAEEAQRRTDWILHRVGMADRRDRRLAGCSRGMRQRTKLAQALLHDPPVLLLDEPMTGIDPAGRRELGRLLRQLAETGKTVIVSSHILAEVESLADRILMLARGRLVASGSIREVRDLLSHQPLTIEVQAQPMRNTAATLIGHPAVTSIEIHQEALRIRTTEAAEVFEAIGQLARDGQATIHRLEVLDAGAEAVFNYLNRAVS